MCGAAVDRVHFRDAMTTENKNCDLSALQVAELTREDLEAAEQPEVRQYYARKLQDQAAPLTHCPGEAIAEEAKHLLEIAENELESLS